ncbi:MAG: apolipoprotein N-acyltransferase [Gammaproteobacteria bacterium]|nr:apolipoprotein N-acyltransferase [Gammaproteobacteria bacterium]
MQRLRARRTEALAVLAGVALSFAFAPFDLWPLAIVAPAGLFALWQGTTPRRAALLGFLFGAGTFGAGTWWLYISIHGFGEAPVWLTLLLIVALVAIMACWQALLGYLAARLLPADGPLRALLGLPALWLLIEWWRGWFLSGFPWLSLGYSQTGTWLAALAPLGGVYLLSAILALGAGALLTLWRGSGVTRWLALALLLGPWLLAFALRGVAWTYPQGAPVAVAVAQGAVPQDLKWQSENRLPTRELYRGLNRRLLGARLIVWPESALPELANDAQDFLKQIYAVSHEHGSDLLMGVVRADGDDYYNSILALGDTVAFYDKRHLVPFAEYFPVPAWVRRWLRLMSLPYADFVRGRDRQPPLAVGGLRVAATICYEDAFGAEQLAVLRSANVLVNVTNDAWFGRSPARFQHFQIARMRALEAGRYLVRAANDGISAVVGPRGEVLAQAAEYRATVLQGTVRPMAGLTPYARAGNVPVVALGLAGALAAIGVAWRHRRRDHVAGR